MPDHRHREINGTPTPFILDIDTCSHRHEAYIQARHLVWFSVLCTLISNAIEMAVGAVLRLLSGHIHWTW